VPRNVGWKKLATFNRQQADLENGTRQTYGIQDIHMVYMEGEEEVLCAVSNGDIADDLERS